MAEFKEVDKPWGWVFQKEVACTVCGEQINPFSSWHTHPRLKTIQCVDCNRFYSRGLWIKDAEGYYEHCRWCGEGGSLLGCDLCIESFCKKCILRNLGRGGLSEAENSTKWKCYCCAPDKIKKHTEFAEKLQKANQQRSEWQQEKDRKAKERKLMKARAATMQKTSDILTSNKNSEVSTDEEEIDQKIHILMKRLESKIDNPKKSTASKKKTKTFIDKLKKTFDTLATKSNSISSSWPKEVITNGNVQNGHNADSSSGTDGDSESDGDNEDALFGTGKKRKRKKRPSDDENNRMKPPSSDEYSDEELAIEMKKKRKEEEEKKKAAATKAKMLREQELEAKLIAEEAKRRQDAERIREKKKEEKDKAEELQRQKDESKNAFIGSDSETEETVEKSPKDEKSLNSSKSEKKKLPKNQSKTKSKDEKKKVESTKNISSSDDEEQTQDSIPDFLKSSDEEADDQSDKESNGSDFEPKEESEEETNDIAEDSGDDEDDEAITKLIEKDLKDKKKEKSVSPKPEKSLEEKESPKSNGVTNEDEAMTISDSDDEKIQKVPAKRDKLLAGKITISSDDDTKAAKTSSEKKKEKKTGSGKKRKRVLSSDEEKNEAASDDENEEEAEEKQKKKKRKRKKKGEDGDSDKENEDKPKKEKTKARKIMTDEKLSEQTKQAEQDERERKARLEKIRGERKMKSGSEFETKDWDGIFNKDPLVQVDEELKNNLKSHQVEGIQFIWDCVIESVKKEGDEYKLGMKQTGNGSILAHCMGLGKTLQAIAFAHTVITHEFLGLQKIVVLCPLNVCENWENEVRKWTGDLGQPLSAWNLHCTTDASERLDLVKEWDSTGGLLILGYTLWRMLTTGANVTKKAKRLIPAFKKILLTHSDIIICDEGHLLKNADSATSKSVKQIKTLRRVVLTGTPMQNNLDEYHCMVDFVRPNLLGTTKEFRNRFANPIRNGENIDASEFDVKLMKKRAFILHKTLDGVVQRKDYSYMCKHLPPKAEYVLSLKLSDVQAKLYKFYLNQESVALDDINKGAGKVSGRGLFKDFQTFLLVNNHPKCLNIQTDNREQRMEKEEINRFLCDEDEEEDSGDEDFDEDKLDQMEDTVKPPEPVDEDELKGLTNYKLRAYILHHHGSLQQCIPSDPRDLLRRATEIFRKQADPENEFLIEEIESLKRPVLKEFILRNGGSQDDITAKSKTELRAIARDLHLKKVTPPPDMEWYEKCLGLDFDMERFELSRKMEILFEIINMCYHLKDKLIVFSQSVITLDIIEHFLNQSTLQGISDMSFINSDDEEEENSSSQNDSKSKKNNAFIAGQKWYKNIDYFRIDGSVSATKRTNLIENFNNPDDPRARLFLVSTKAGGIGTNLVGANRVIIFDSSWNPSHDVQSLFRVYRFGQTKDVFVYRFVGFGTMEEKIYERQVNKSSLGLRVVDEQQVDRHYSAEQLKELYNFVHEPKEPVAPSAPPKDPILGELLRGEKTKGWVLKYHQHDSLLEHRPEEQLSKDEIARAWEEYDNEKKGIFTHMYAPQPAGVYGGSYNMPYQNANMMQWENLNKNITITKATWLHTLTKHAVEKLVQVGKQLLDENRGFFDNRRMFTLDQLIELVLTYDPSIGYMQARKLAHSAFYNIQEMQLNERNVYRMGTSIYKQLEQRLSELGLVEIQQRMLQQQRARQQVGNRLIQPRR